MAEMKEKTAAEPRHQFELLKSPIVAEFLGFRTEDSFAESDLESAILSHIRDFLMEMGKGFAFVARQQHIVTDTEDYYIDLVFYNIELKCYVLIDLKMGTITHQDVGQIDMYVRMYDELKCKEGDNPTIGILLCGETSEDIARYSVLHDNDHLFMSKYLTYLPTKEQLRAEIERQKNIFYILHLSKQDFSFRLLSFHIQQKNIVDCRIIHYGIFIFSPGLFLVGHQHIPLIIVFAVGQNFLFIELIEQCCATADNAIVITKFIFRFAEKNLALMNKCDIVSDFFQIRCDM